MASQGLWQKIVTYMKREDQPHAPSPLAGGEPGASQSAAQDGAAADAGAGANHSAAAEPSQAGGDAPSTPGGEELAQVRYSMERLSHLPESLSRLAGALQSQAQLNERMQSALTTLAGPNQELLQSLHDLAMEGQKQTDLLEALRSDLDQRHESDVQMAGAISSLSQSLESFNRSNAAHIEIMEQMRDRWANAKDDIAQQLVRQGRKMAGLLIAILLVLAVGVAAVVFRAVAGK